MFRFFQIIIRGFHRSLLKLLYIHDLVRFSKQSVVAVYHTNIFRKSVKIQVSLKYDNFLT